MFENEFATKMKALFNDLDGPVLYGTKYIDKVMIGHLNPTLLAKVELLSRFAGDPRFDSIRISVINKTAGLVDQQTFKFEDLIGFIQPKGIVVPDPNLSPCLWVEADQTLGWNGQVDSEQEVQIRHALMYYILMYRNTAE